MERASLPWFLLFRCQALTSWQTKSEQALRELDNFPSPLALESGQTFNLGALLLEDHLLSGNDSPVCFAFPCNIVKSC